MIHIGNILDAPCHFGEDRVRDVRNDYADGRRFLARQPARYGIWTIAKTFNGFEYFLACLRLDVWIVVDNPRHCRHRHARFSCYIINGYRHVLLSIASNFYRTVSLLT
ncbi:hypothetical protein D3C84_925010 [compost metagenome]